MEQRSQRLFSRLPNDGTLVTGEEADIVECWKDLYAEIMHHYMLTHVDMSDKLRIMFNLIDDTPALQNEEVMNFIQKYSLAPREPVRFGGRQSHESFAKRLLKKARRAFR